LRPGINDRNLVPRELEGSAVENRILRIHLEKRSDKPAHPRRSNIPGKITTAEAINITENRIKYPVIKIYDLRFMIEAKQSAAENRQSTIRDCYSTFDCPTADSCFSFSFTSLCETLPSWSRDKSTSSTRPDSTSSNVQCIL
jgi:hypothetical protein